jgi:hypothetical protein
MAIGSAVVSNMSEDGSVTLRISLSANGNRKGILLEYTAPEARRASLRSTHYSFMTSSRRRQLPCVEEHNGILIHVPGKCTVTATDGPAGNREERQYRMDFEDIDRGRVQALLRQLSLPGMYSGTTADGQGQFIELMGTYSYQEWFVSVSSIPPAARSSSRGNLRSRLLGLSGT